MPADSNSMDEGTRGNWVGGRWTPAVGGHPGDEGPGGVRWPRSGRPDVAAALEACARASVRWARLPRSERKERLARVADTLEASGALEEDLGAALRLDATELRPRLSADALALREAVELAADSGVESSGVVLFQAHWSDLAGQLAGRLAARLIAGQTALVLADPLVPQATWHVLRALEEADLPPGTVCGLFARGREVLEHALASPGLAGVRLRGHTRTLAGLEERFQRPAGPSWSLWPLRNVSHVVAEGADPVSEAREVVRKAVGRSDTLSGQFPGQIGRVLCHQRLFSRFTEELLAALEASPDVHRPVPPIEPDLAEHVQAAWALGLDEGATPIFGVEPAGSDGLGPAVFTNVEPRQAFARLDRPAPVLGLFRTGSDEDSRELAARFDGPRGWPGSGRT